MRISPLELGQDGDVGDQATARQLLAHGGLLAQSIDALHQLIQTRLLLRSGPSTRTESGAVRTSAGDALSE